VTLAKGAGLLLVLFGLVLLIPKQQQITFRNINAAWLLVFVFLATGFADSSLKIYEEDFSSSFDELQFMGTVFAFAFIIGLSITLFRHRRGIRINELTTGALIGIPNLYSSVFMIYALKKIDGAVAYPAVNVLNVVGGTLLGLWFWNDNVTRLQWLGIGTTIAAILLLV
ncbi:MAG: EamA family transporter, partial [Balneolaceae bacterium]|nr:EamA family transporter [Balneolaceae bacterium]